MNTNRFLTKRIHRSVRHMLVLGTLWMSFTSCEKEDSVVELNQNQIAYVVADNFDLSLFNRALHLTGWNNKLLEEGSFTLLVPSNRAFSNRGIENVSDLLVNGQEQLEQMIQYLLLERVVDFENIPLGSNQEITSISGGKLFVTRQKRGTETLTLINGSLLSPLKVEASNGVVRQLAGVPEPYLYDQVGDAIAAETELTIFYEVLHRSGVLDEMAKGTYTIFAPNNNAMRNAGYNSILEVSKMDKEDLRRFVNAHIIDERHFGYDYVLLSEEGSYSTPLTMRNGDEFLIRFTFDYQNQNSLTGIILSSADNMLTANVPRKDIPAGNGVLHILDRTLK